MRYLSLFSGIEACSVAWKPLGWECVGVAEIEPAPCSVLKHHYPNVPNLGDVTKVSEMDIAALGPIDVVVFGSPCQDLSVAGKRKGLEGARSGLFFTAIDIIRYAREWCGLRWALWENVPGAFSSNQGADFAAVVEHLSGLGGIEAPPKGWGTEGCAAGPEAMVEWATLDAQWFGVAQRRRRVFALADFGDWSNRPPILLESESLRGDSAPRREAGQGAAGTLAARSGGGGVSGTAERLQRPVLAFGGGNSPAIDTAPTCTAHGLRLDFDSEMFLVQPVAATLLASHGRLRGSSGQDLNHGHSHLVPVLPFDTTQITSPHNYSSPQPGDPCHPLAAGAHPPAVAQFAPLGVTVHCRDVAQTLTGNYGKQVDNSDTALGPNVVAALTPLGVRRLTPKECERLQGFPDTYTLTPHGKKMMADGPRYKALGNSMAVPVMRWIGQQIEFTHLWF